MSSPKDTTKDAAPKYASLRLREPGHKLRYGHGAKLVESGSDQTVTFQALPFPHFCVEPGGIQIPIQNVASAIPVGASLASRIRRTTSSRLTPKATKEDLDVSTSDEG